jgi:hypothetical protein
MLAAIGVANCAQPILIHAVGHPTVGQGRWRTHAAGLRGDLGGLRLPKCAAAGAGKADEGVAGAERIRTWLSAAGHPPHRLRLGGLKTPRSQPMFASAAMRRNAPKTPARADETA